MAQTPAIDILTIGETLIDFISTEMTGGLRHADTFRRHLGGSPANIAVNVARLGLRSAVISKIGAGAFGGFLADSLRANGVVTDFLARDATVRTSVIFVSRTVGTPEFEAFRDADYRLAAHEISDTAIAAAKVVHASTFALSKEPCRSAIKSAFERAHRQRKIISLDPNYSPLIWDNRAEALAILRTLFRRVSITKASLDDARRLFGADISPRAAVDRLHDWGAETVVFTLGGAGSLVSKKGGLMGYLPARTIAIADATGAGDAFWAGYLTAQLDGQPPEACLLFAREVVELKLQTVGTLPATVNRTELFARAKTAASDLRHRWADVPGK